MALEEIKQFLMQSLEDHKLSKNELAVFKEMLKQSAPNLQQLHLLRHEIFQAAKEKVRHPRDREILLWISDLVKGMFQESNVEHIPDEVLFFPDSRSHRRFLEVLSSAIRSMDICVFTITDNRISRTILDAHEQGVQVRIVTDNDKSMDLGSDIEKLMAAGVPVRMDNTDDHMHHKFAILDQKVLINGSFNWTRSASGNNRENMTFCYYPPSIQSFQAEFDSLWLAYGG
ncbi:MAG: phospholipase D-like domain-containing protein [Myxococcota bacterium]